MVDKNLRLFLLLFAVVLIVGVITSDRPLFSRGGLTVLSEGGSSSGGGTSYGGSSGGGNNSGNVTCYDNSGCKDVISNYCGTNNSACTSTTSYNCFNPGTLNSYCGSVGGSASCSSPCEYGCSNGACNNNQGNGTFNQTHNSLVTYQGVLDMLNEAFLQVHFYDNSLGWYTCNDVCNANSTEASCLSAYFRYNNSVNDGALELTECDGTINGNNLQIAYCTCVIP